MFSDDTGKPGTAVPFHFQAYTFISQEPITTSETPSPSKSPKAGEENSFPPHCFGQPGTKLPSALNAYTLLSYEPTTISKFPSASMLPITGEEKTLSPADLGQPVLSVGTPDCEKDCEVKIKKRENRIIALVTFSISFHLDLKFRHRVFKSPSNETTWADT